MSKYNKYAKRLDEAFRQAKGIYAKEYNAYIEAKRNYDTACNMWRETYNGEKEYKQTIAKASLAEAKKQLDNSQAWNSYDNAVKALTDEIKAEVKSNSVVDTESIDNSAVTLLQSGVMGVDDFLAMKSKYNENNTMLRLISSYAEKTAERLSDDNYTERSKLKAIAEATKHGDASKIDDWNNLVDMCKSCSGGRDRTAHDYVIAMNAEYDNHVGNVIDSF